MTQGTTKKSNKLRDLFLLGLTILGMYMFFPNKSPSSSSANSTTNGYDESASRRLCEAAVHQWAKYPSTVDFHSIMGYGTVMVSGNTRRIAQDFSAKNGFGLELIYTADCEVSPKGELVHFAIVEKGGQTVTTTLRAQSPTRKCFGKSPPGTDPHCYYGN